MCGPVTKSEQARLPGQGLLERNPGLEEAAQAILLSLRDVASEISVLGNMIDMETGNAHRAATRQVNLQRSSTAWPANPRISALFCTLSAAVNISVTACLCVFLI